MALRSILGKFCLVYIDDIIMVERRGEEMAGPMEEDGAS